MHKLNQNLKRLLNEAKLSENELARRTGVPQQMINRILSGYNQNPKIATLAPLANYFSITISQLLGDEAIHQETRLKTKHMGWQEAPLVEWNQIGQIPLDELILKSKARILTDANVSANIFATKMSDTSMEPKFTINTLLIFDSKKIPSDKDFVLLCTPEHEIILRQIFMKNARKYSKCFNLRYKDYKLTLIHPETICLAVLIQSRTDHMLSQID